MNANNMKNTDFEKQTDQMMPEYDFSDGVPNKYAKQLKEDGCIIRVYQPDGSFTERRVLGEKTIVLDADVWEYFSTSEAVNHALRTLISLIPDKQTS